MVDKLTQVRFTYVDANGKQQVKTMKVEKNFIFDFKNSDGYDIGSYRINEKGQFVDVLHPKNILNQFEVTEAQLKEYEGMAGLVNDGGLTAADKDAKQLQDIRSEITNSAKKPDSGFKWYNPFTWF